jgi:hypothetical protein
MHILNAEGSAADTDNNNPQPEGYNMSNEMIERSFQCSECPTKCRVLIAEDDCDTEDPNQCLYDDASIDAEWEQVDKAQLETESDYDKRLEELDIQQQELAIRRGEAEIAVMELSIRTGEADLLRSKCK